MKKPTATNPTSSTSGPVAAPVSFLRASGESTEYFGDRTTPMAAASSTQISDEKIPAFGWLRSILVWVQVTGATNTLATVALKEDAPWSVLQNLAITDTNGRPLSGPFSGHHLYLAHKWFPTSQWELEPTNSPMFSAMDADGNFSFVLRIPVEVGGRDAMCALPNQQNDNRYRLAYDVSAASSVYSTPPDGDLPDVRVRCLYEAWAPADAASPDGAPVQTTPPFPGSTLHLSLATPDINQGDHVVPITRVGNLVRGVALIARDNTGARTDDAFPEVIRFTKDGRQLHVIHSAFVRHYMRERTGLDPDTGVLVFDFEHDLDGRVGAGMREQWLQTSQSTRLEVSGQWGSDAAGGSLQVLVNDVRPAGAMTPT